MLYYGVICWLFLVVVRLWVQFVCIRVWGDAFALVVCGYVVCLFPGLAI